MREIKFRAWDSYNKKMIELGDLESISMRKTAGHDDDFANFELMQYTGLKDVNGTDIFEGDIVKYIYGKNSTGILTFEGYEWKVKTNKKTWLSDPWSDVVGREGETLEVIGNIYETQQP